MKKQTGFTLIELAIVLVIIGLLLGGVLKGQELINQAKIKNVVNDFNGTAAAYYGYQDRYHAIAGDDKNAGGTGGRWTDATAGDGNGKLATGTTFCKYSDSGTTPTECQLFWQDLRLAGFIGGSGTQPPNNAVAGLLGVQMGEQVGTSGALGGLSGIIICSSNLPDRIAIAVDQQLDDGLPDKGTIRAQLQTGASNPDISATAATTYAETGSNVYTLCKSL